jgi:hypothetical protein
MKAQGTSRSSAHTANSRSALAARMTRGASDDTVPGIVARCRTGGVGLALQPALQGMQIPYEVRGAGDLWQGVAARLVLGRSIIISA